MHDEEVVRKALNGALGRALVRDGYRRRERLKYTSFRLEAATLYPSGLKGVKVYRCRTWTWDVDFQGADCWLTPKPTWTKVTEMPAVTFARWFRHREVERRWTVVNVKTGKTWTSQTLVDHEDAEWADDPYARVVYGPRTGEAESSPRVQEIHEAVRAESAFADIADVGHLRELEALHWHRVSGQRLMIRKSLISERKEVIQRGVHQKPLSPVTLAFVIPAQDASARDTLLYRFADTGAVESAGLNAPATNVPYIWNTKWKLRREAKLTWLSTPFTYVPATGRLVSPERLRHVARQVEESGRTLVTVTVLPHEGMSREANAVLFAGVRPFNHVVVDKEAGVPKDRTETAQACWSAATRIALKILRAGGGLPYKLVPEKGSTSGTYYLGLDVGSAHKGGWSNVAMVLVDWEGRVVAKRVQRCEENNERIPSDLLMRTLPQWLDELSERDYDRFSRIGAPRIQHLVVHRDGRFMDHEAEELREALSHLRRLDLIEVKKNSALRVQVDSEGPMICRLGGRTAVVFNDSALGGRTKPIEVQAMTDTDVLEAAEQVFWLSEMRTDELYRPGRLPLTTFLADRMATTAH